MNFDIRFIKDNEIDKVKSLFCLCFDSEIVEANIFYRPQQKRIIGAFIGDTLCSMMTVFDCEAVLQDKTVSAGYIAGVATAPEYRGNKLFKRCFDYFCEAEHNFKLLFCIPATKSLFQLYNNAGLDKATYVKQAYFTGSGKNNIIASVESMPLEKLSAINDERKLVIRKTPELAAATAEAFLYYGGKIINADNFVAFIYENNEEVTVADICTKDYNTALEQVLNNIENGKKVRVILPSNQYTTGIEGDEIPIAVYKVLEDKLMLDGLYINLLFNDI